MSIRQSPGRAPETLPEETLLRGLSWEGMSIRQSPGKAPETLPGETTGDSAGGDKNQDFVPADSPACLKFF